QGDDPLANAVCAHISHQIIEFPSFDDRKYFRKRVIGQGHRSARRFGLQILMNVSPATRRLLFRNDVHDALPYSDLDLAETKRGMVRRSRYILLRLDSCRSCLLKGPCTSWT